MPTNDELRRDVSDELAWDPNVDGAEVAVCAQGGVVTHRRAHDNVRDALPALLALAVSSTYLIATQ